MKTAIDYKMDEFNWRILRGHDMLDSAMEAFDKKEMTIFENLLREINDDFGKVLSLSKAISKETCCIKP